MKQANISTTKNNLSKLIDEVRKGESIVIVDRDVPVARLDPVGDLGQFAGRIPALAREGVVALPRSQLDVKQFLARSKPRLPAERGVVDALLRDREESR